MGVTEATGVQTGAAGATGVQTGRYVFDSAHTRIGFAARYAMITTVRGEFTEFTGHAYLDGDDPLRSSATVSIATASVNTSQSQRDEHLRGPDFLDVRTYPEITFRSTAVEPGEGGHYRMVGDLTICGITRSVPLDFALTGMAADGPGHQLVGFDGSAVISRSDFGLTWNSVLETGGLLVGDEITLQFDVSAVQARDGEGEGLHEPAWWADQSGSPK